MPIQIVLSGVGPTVTFICFVLVDEGRKDPNTCTTISGPSSTPSKMPFKWRFPGVLVMAQHAGLVAF